MLCDGSCASNIYLKARVYIVAVCFECFFKGAFSKQKEVQRAGPVNEVTVQKQEWVAVWIRPVDMTVI